MGIHEDAIAHIAVDQAEVAWISGTTFKVKDIVEDRLAYGWSPEEIRFQHHNKLTLAQIHAAFSYYYDHQEKIDRQIRAELDNAEKLRFAQNSQDEISRKLREQPTQK